MKCDWCPQGVDTRTDKPHLERTLFDLNCTDPTTSTVSVKVCTLLRLAFTVTILCHDVCEEQNLKRSIPLPQPELFRALYSTTPVAVGGV